MLRHWDLSWVEMVSAVPFALTRPRSSQDVLEQGVRFESELAAAQQALAQGKPAAALDALHQARNIPGYERSPQVLDAWSRVTLRSRRCGLRGGWTARTFGGDLVDGDYICLCAFSPDGRWGLSDGVGFSLGLWDLASGERLRTFKGHTGIVNSVAISPDGRWGLSGSGMDESELWSRDNNVRLWDLASGQCLRTFKGYTERVKSVAISPDGRRGLSGSDDKTLKLWDLASGKFLRAFEGHTEVVNSVAISPDGRWGLSGSDDKTLKLWDLASGKFLRAFEGHTDKVYSVAISPDGQWGLSGSGDKTLRLWDLDSGQCLRTFAGHASAIISAAISPDARWVLSGSWDRTLRLWELGWELEFPEPVDWDEGARPYLETFLTLHTPYPATLPSDREPTQQEVTQALTRRGKPKITKEDFKQLLYTLGCAGYGWLRPEGVKKKLLEMAANWTGPPALE